MTEKKQFRVLIAGGGVAGLTLANALEQGGVDFLLLDRRKELAPQVGAGIALLPNGCRILDQLGVYDELMKQSELHVWSADRDSNGNLLAPRSDFAPLMATRTGYHMSFEDRQIILQLLYNRIQDKSKIMTEKRIVDVIHSSDDDGVTVKCEDGTSYHGDILAGADGVYSKTREALWKFVEKHNPKLVEKDKNALAAEYQCLFGICSLAPGLEIAAGDYGYDRDRSSLAVVGRGGRTYYFIFQKLDRVYRGTEIPHYSRKEAEKFAKAHSDMKIRPNVTFAQLWERTSSSALVALEEATFETWTWGRIACLGDSIHKMTPNIGTGGNAAIESAAALASAIKEMLDKTPRPTESQIKAALTSYQKIRQVRAADLVKINAQVTRLQALRDPIHLFIAWWCVPYLGDLLADTAADIQVGASAISYLPLPLRSTQCTMPFNPNQGIGHKESLLKRAALGLPFVVLFFAAKNLMDPTAVLSLAADIVKDGGNLPWGGSVATSFYHVKWLDDILAKVVVFFSPALWGLDAVAPQAFLFLVDYGVIIAVWLIECVRRANALTASQLPLLFLLASQLVGVGVVSPLYYLLHYTSSQIENFKAADMRLTRVAYTKVIFPALVMVYYVPLYLCFFAPSLPQRVSSAYVWQLFPVFLSVLASQVLSRLPANTTMHDRIHNVRSDLPAIRFTVGTLSLHSAAVWVYYACFSVLNMRDTAIAALLPSLNEEKGLVMLAGNFLRWDQTFLFANTFIWLGYLFWDIKHAGMLEMAWARIWVMAVSAIVVLGPGAAAGLGWLWREELLASRRHSSAVTEEVAREWNKKLELGENGEVMNGKKH
ncbi:hypothetical protein B0H66DRAFT_609095 [Apodospora peruviana]|uniref:FAD-binding domain-containing protein n=1 Tax=Apodospora peruviana TaxID=516989 RepID=A0AAE0HS00_9PEZI|nr:hypothetical protein B0H66DRAFT_609095 [Apodospora peruviana]